MSLSKIISLLLLGAVLFATSLLSILFAYSGPGLEFVLPFHIDTIAALFLLPMALYTHRFLGYRIGLVAGLVLLFAAVFTGTMFSHGFFGSIFSIARLVAGSVGTALIWSNVLRCALDVVGNRVQAMTMTSLGFLMLWYGAAWFSQDIFLLVFDLWGATFVLVTLAVGGLAMIPGYFLLTGKGPTELRQLKGWEKGALAPQKKFYKNVPEMRFIWLVGILFLGSYFFDLSALIPGLPMWGMLASLVTWLIIAGWQYADKMRAVRLALLMVGTTLGFIGVHQSFLLPDTAQFVDYYTMAAGGALAVGLVLAIPQLKFFHGRGLPLRLGIALLVIMAASLDVNYWTSLVLVGLGSALLFSSAVPLVQAHVPENRRLMGTAAVLIPLITPGDWMTWAGSVGIQSKIPPGWSLFPALTLLTVFAVLYHRSLRQA